MPDFSPGPLFNSSRYEVLRRAVPGASFLHHGTMTLEHVSRGDSELKSKVLIKSINYGAYLADTRETFEEFVVRRRKELRHEAEMLATYHEMTSHVPQILDIVIGENQLDAEVMAAGLADGELCLVLEAVEVESLGDVRGPLPSGEVLAIAEKVLLILRVFHSLDARSATARQFCTLSPRNIFFDRLSRDCWFHNLSSLRTERGAQRGTPCEPQLQAFVSPRLAPTLWPRPKHVGSPPSGTGHPDLYSLAVVLYYLLEGGPDLSGEPPGFLNRSRVEQLANKRPLDSAFVEFLVKLAEHRFTTAQDALAELCRLRGRRTQGKFYSGATSLPRLEAFDGARQDRIAAGGSVGRFYVQKELGRGAQGVVFVGVDQVTNSRVIIKAPLYEDTDVDTRRSQFQAEAEAYVRMHNRTGGTPQIIDFLQVPPEPGSSPTRTTPDPVLVLEYIPGVDLGDSVKGRALDEHQLLEMLYAASMVAASIHRADSQGNYYVYLDWKHENFRFHQESGNVTLLDLGGVAPVKAGRLEGLLSSSKPYEAPEVASEQVDRTQVNQTTDIYALAAVIWTLASQHAGGKIGDLIIDLESGKSKEEVFDVQKLPQQDYPYLIPVLRQAMQVKQKDRYQTAENLAAAALRALGCSDPTPPESPLELTVQPLDGDEVRVRCRLPLDTRCEKIFLYRGAKALNLQSLGKPFHEHKFQTDEAGSYVEWKDSIDPAWEEVHYAAASHGYNGNDSAPIAAHTQLLSDPGGIELRSGEEAIELVWKTPSAVKRRGGQVIVERITPNPDVLYRGTGEMTVDEKLDATREHRYRFRCKLPWGTSKGVEKAATPLPQLGSVEDLKSVAGHGQVTLRWEMPKKAVEQVMFIRSRREFSRDEVLEAAARAKRDEFTTLEFQLDGHLRIKSLAKGPGTLQAAPDGSCWLGQWTDHAVEPGAQYYYTPVLSYRGAKPWAADTVDATPYAEATRFDADPLPGAVRLRWRLPAHCRQAVLERLSGDDAVDQSWDAIAAGDCLLDGGRTSGQNARYRLRCQVGNAWSPGATTQAQALAVEEVLPPLTQTRPPIEPRGVSKTQTQQQLTVSWQKAACPLVLVSIPEIGELELVPSSAGEATFQGVHDNSPLVIVRGVSGNGELSAPVTAAEAGA